MLGEQYRSELYHYGVVGMKWGVRRALYKSNRNVKLERKALDYDRKSAKYNKKSEKLHAKNDLEGSNSAGIKAAQYKQKAAKLQKKALNQDNELKKSILEKRAARLNYKSTVKTMKANMLSKTAGYGAEAMKYSIKSDKMARKAAKARMYMANNEVYITKMKKQISQIPEGERRNGYEFVNKLVG